MILFRVVDYGGSDVGWEGVGAWKAEPACVDACESTKGVVVFEKTVAEEPVEVAEAPGYEAETRHAEEGVEDLRVDLDPDFAQAVFAVAAAWMAEGGRGVEKDEEDHGAPGDDVECVDGHDEAERRAEEGPEGLETDGAGLLPGVFWGEAIAIGICACFVGADGTFAIGDWVGRRARWCC